MAKHPTNKYDYSDPEVLKRLLCKHYMSDEKRKELEEKTASGELVVISNDDPFRPYYPLVPLEKSQADLRKLMQENGISLSEAISERSKVRIAYSCS